MDQGTIHREILSRIFSAPEESIDIQRIKREVCRKYGVSIPRNSEILAIVAEKERETVRRKLILKPTRTLSGVAPLAVMTSPFPCPHGKCLPCPGGPNHPFRSPQSYTGEEPAALRGREHRYDPYAQVEARLRQFHDLGHPVGKVELIVMGGTITARDPRYQEGFVRGCLEALNDLGGLPPAPGISFEEIVRAHERSSVRCIGITFETRPDRCGPAEINRMLSLGVTKVELGVQALDDAILERNRRGCTVTDTVQANTRLRDSGLKVGFHVMPNLPGSTLESDRAMFQTLFRDPSYRPDFLKIYPTLVTPHSEIEALWKAGSYAPYPEEDLVELLAEAKAVLPEYVRLQRIQRDIPARLIEAGSRHSNFRQLARERLEAQGGTCRCIRCREIGRCDPGETPRPREVVYSCCGGEEHFISLEFGEALAGFARLRFPGKTPWPELTEAALLRELHVYGELVPVGERPNPRAWQHRRYGSDLLDRAEERALEEGYPRIAVMSGIGVRPYYRRHGYEQRGPYMVKELR